MFVAKNLLFTPPIVAAPTNVTVKGTPTTAAAATTVTLPTHAVGDLIIVYAYNASNTTVPTIPTAGGTVPTWTSFGVGGGTLEAAVCGWAVATATNHTSGTWTNATNGLAAIVLTGNKSSSPIGAGAAHTEGLSTTGLPYPALASQTNTDGTSLILHIGGHRTLSAIGTVPTGYTSQIASLNPFIMALSKNSSTSDGAVTWPCTSTNGRCLPLSIEVLAH
jgi:hypothetical protein